MAKEKDWLYEEEGCSNCGELDYIPSKVAGLCDDCLDYETSYRKATEDFDRVFIERTFD